MWIIPSRSRPQNISRLVKAFQDTGAMTPVLLRLDDDDPLLTAYLRIEVDWEVVVAKRAPLSEIYNDVFDRRLDWYGFLADDVLPETPRWDRALINAAGPNGMAHCDDGIGGQATHFVVGGNLVREIGWVALPGLHRTYIDTVWNAVANERGVLRYLPDVKLTHLHFSNRLAMFDQTYRKPAKTHDRAIYRAWLNRKDDDE